MKLILLAAALTIVALPALAEDNPAALKACNDYVAQHMQFGTSFGGSTAHTDAYRQCLTLYGPPLGTRDPGYPVLVHPPSRQQ